MLARLVDEQLFDEAVRAECDNGEKRLVVLDLAYRAHRADDLTGPHFLGLHADALDLVEADLDGARLALLIVVHGDVVHPHGILLGHRRGIRQSHRIAIVEDLPLGARWHRLLGLSRRPNRCRWTDIPIGARRAGGSTHAQDDKALQTAHGASPN